MLLELPSLSFTVPYVFSGCVFFLFFFLLLFYCYLWSVWFLLKHSDNERALGGLHDFCQACVLHGTGVDGDED